MHTVPEQLTLSIPSNPRYLCTMRAFFDSLLQELGFSQQERHGVILAVHEACANVIKHCYQGDRGQRIDLTVAVTSACLTIDIRDYGARQDLTAIRPRALQDIRPGGLGTYLMQALMDDITYHSSATGTLVRMIKRRRMPCTSP